MREIGCSNQPSENDLGIDMKRKLKGDPLPKLWQYHEDDKTTWRYINCVIGGKSGRLYVSKWIENPEFKYLHLCKD